jgi:hypothetical protein
MAEKNQHEPLPNKPASSISFQFKTSKQPRPRVSSPTSSVSLVPNLQRTVNSSFSSTSSAHHIHPGTLPRSSNVSSPSSVFGQTEEYDEEEGQAIEVKTVQSISVIEGTFIPRHEEEKEKPKYIIPMSPEDQEAARLLLEGKL